MLKSLVDLVRDVGEALLVLRKQGRTEGHWEGAQFKAAADLLADQRLHAGLPSVAALPIVSEETTASHSSARPERYWLIDPIDGTASFAHGYDGFVCQVALMQAHRPVMAAVYAPAKGHLYSAEAGKGAWLNGARLQVAGRSTEERVLVDNYPQPKGNSAELFRKLSCAKYVESGSIGLKICLVADGSADVFVKDVTVRDWDIAPAELILGEAGGRLVRTDGSSFDYGGSYEKNGVVAVSSQQALVDVLGALAELRRG